MKSRVINQDSLGIVVQQIRLFERKSQRQFAKEHGLTQRWLNELENGKKSKTMDKLFKLLSELGVKVECEFEVSDE